MEIQESIRRITSYNVCYTKLLRQGLTSSTFDPAIAQVLLPYHPEYCHLQYCNLWSTFTNYNNTLLNAVNNASWPTSTPTQGSLFDQPYAQVYTGYSTGDPFTDASLMVDYQNTYIPFNGTNNDLLQTAVDT